MLSYKDKVSIINDKVHPWHVQVKVDVPTLNVTCNVLQTKALAFQDWILKDHLATTNPELVESWKKFKASNGWLQNYFKQKGTTSQCRCGKLLSADRISIEQCLTEIRKLLEDIPLQSIWNLDETAIQHRITSLHSYMTINSDGCGIKHSKDCTVVKPIVSTSGEKLIPQVIRKSKQPCVLKGIDIDKKYQVKYDIQSMAWQDRSSMLQLFCQIAGVAQSHKSTMYLLLDNCSSHMWLAKSLHPEGLQETNFEIANLVIVFSPPNATSNFQPLDQCIIQSLKAQFWKAQHHTSLSEYEIW